MNANILQVTYHIRGFQRKLYGSAPSWSHCTFEQGEDLDVVLRFSEAGLTAATDLDAAVSLIDGRVRQLVLAWEFQLGRRLELRRLNIAVPRFPVEGDRLVLDDTVVFSDYVEAYVTPPPAPNEMPQEPLRAERWIRTLAEAGDFSGYVEEQLRRHYLIIEELWDEYGSQFEAAELAKYQDIKLVRHFVSHAECQDKNVVKFISAQLPSAIVAGTSRPTVRFNRDIEHRNFVARYEVDSGQIARALVRFAIRNLSLFP